MDIPKLIPTAEPFFFPGNSTGCLLVHGFTGTPKEMRPLGEYLHARGYSVLGVRLAGHATRPADMIRMRWEDWLASVEDGWHMLSGCSERIFVIGLSLGGVLALTFASDYPVAGAAALATPHHMPDDPRVRWIKPLSLFQRFVDKGPSDWRDRAAEADHISYPADPTRSLAEVRDLLSLMRQRLPQVTAPVLLVNSKEDRTVRADDRHAEQILAGLGSRTKQVVWVENSCHVITRDAAREKVFLAVQTFIEMTVQGEV